MWLEKLVLWGRRLGDSFVRSVLYIVMAMKD